MSDSVGGRVSGCSWCCSTGEDNIELQNMHTKHRLYTNTGIKMLIWYSGDSYAKNVFV